MLKTRVKQLETEIGLLEDALTNMEVAVIDGYFVRLWQDTDGWVAYCPTVGSVVELDSRQQALDGITEDTRDMVAALVELGEAPPGKDISR